MPRVLIRKRDGATTARGDDETRDGRENEAIEYRGIVAEAMGIKLPQHSIVHHRNRKRHDNRVENLLLMPNQALHALIHSYINRKQQRFRLELERWCLEWGLELMKPRAGVEHFKRYATILTRVEEDLAAIGHEAKSGSAATQQSYLDQYFAAKAEYPRHIVFIQRGCFFDVFDEDAEELNRLFKYRTYANRYSFERLATGTSVDNRRVFEDLQSLGRSYVVVAQSPFKHGRIFQRDVVETFQGRSLG